MPRQRQSRSTQANIPGERQQDLKVKAGQARDIHPLAGQDSEKMIASGWQTAAPQMNDIEAVTVTDSACMQLLERSRGVSDLNRPLYSASERSRTEEVYRLLDDGLITVSSSFVVSFVPSAPR